MPHILNSDESANSDIIELDDASPIPGYSLSWETVCRCAVIAGVVVLVGLISWRPAMLRFSQLMFIVSPSHGDSLAWRPEPDPPSRPTSKKFTVAPSEWRLSANGSDLWKPSRETLRHRTAITSGNLLDGEWRRFSFNPWSWRDDTTLVSKRLTPDTREPDSQPVTSFRAKNSEDWNHAAATPPESTSSEKGGDSSLREQRYPALSVMPSLSPVPLEIPPLIPATKPSVSVQGSDSIFQENDRSELPVLANNEEEANVTEESAKGEEVSPVETVESTVSPEQHDQIAPDPVARISEMKSVESQPVIDDSPFSIASGSAFHQVDDIAQDWSNTEISHAIPGAYLTIYPKLRFIGLCVPGQGYVRKYNQIGVPGDLERPKVSAHDGRTPYGKYFIAGRNRGRDGLSLTLSWPSPEDGERAGLSAGDLLAVENAWLGQKLPPQNTEAGGGVYLRGGGDMIEETDGGFSLEEPHMEEIFMALPDGAWVFIQP